MNHTAHLSRSGLVALPLALVLAACGGGEPSASPRRTASPSPVTSAEPTPAQERPMHTDTPSTRSRPTPDPAERADLAQQLQKAAWDDDVARARRLIRQGADVNAKDETQQSAYLIATSEGEVPSIRVTPLKRSS